MDKVTIEQLNRINQDFYRTTADHFELLRRGAWPGWRRLLIHLEDLKQPLSVLDVGCGNGRFGAFLAQHLDPTLAYHGVDSNARLLEHAAITLQPAIAQGMRVRLESRDIVKNPLEPDLPHPLPLSVRGEGRGADMALYNLVVLFGVLHHIPGADQRRMLMRDLAARVAPGGVLAFASWRFYEYARYRDRLLPLPDDLMVEPHDYLLDWRRGIQAVRYCHYVDDAEQSALIAATDLIELETYRADGDTGDVNCYSILRAPDER
ncbi:MAG: class I SAM-dependent methyltransferase [Chloroflexota bacterium]